ncbi:hypothetical protein LTR37_002894 [Vermiconidia calcicola]|uniref:Uncharacterized protein n=1 Tax=Vermiconidia calcicola TaxID=1690605 RepID=A0ACC3NSI7_9PEZI|nr:hypothetical protein LTR37_002894 [Vermiconidia calcicola]
MPEMQQRNRHLSNSTAQSPSSSADRDPRQPTSLPPWVHVNDGEEEQVAPLIPAEAVPNTRHYKYPASYYKPPPTHYKPGRKWDHERSAEPALLSAPIEDHQLRWKPFMQSGPQPQAGEGRVVDLAWMEQNMPDMNRDYDPEDEVEADRGILSARGLMYRGKWLISPERQERTVRVFWRLLLKNPFVPLVFRMVVFTFSIAALAMAASIYREVKAANVDQDPNNQCAKRASMYMAICVGAIALPYIGYVTWDEYMSKPLGLRSVPAKILLLLCDLYFVVFSSSNVSLAIDTLSDRRWACYDEHFSIEGDQRRIVQATCPDNPVICQKQKALSGVLMVSLIAWCVTFSLSVLRVVEKLRPD